MVLLKEQLQQNASSLYWWHSIDLGNGVVTNGVKSAYHLANELQSLRLPDLRGKTVLDIGAWDGFYSFQAEGLGAKRVLALDHYVWSLDLPATFKYWDECKQLGVIPQQHHKMPFWQPSELPGKRAYDTAHQALGSKVETLVADFMDIDLDEIGTFDVVLYLGVLYHMENPLQALKRLAAVTGEVAIIETEAVVFPGYQHLAVCEFFESNELNYDVSNWWVPNEKALAGMCRAAGFSRVETIVGPKKSSSILSKISMLWGSKPKLYRYRAIIHAYK